MWIGRQPLAGCCLALLRCVARLGEGACFGERALLRDDVRYASVLATSRLFTLYIRRDTFEAVLGKLADLVPDTYQ